MLSNLEVWRFWSTSGVVEELHEHCVILERTDVARRTLLLDHLTRVWRFVLVDDLLAFSPSLRYQAGFRFQEESN